MKRRQFSIFTKLTILIFSLLVVLGALFISITYFATTYYHQASTQLLNKEVAGHIAKFTSPFTASGIDKQKADSVFQNAMVLSPAAEVYFLDTTGKVIYFHASEKDIKQWLIEPGPLKKYIENKGEKYIKGIDPKDPQQKKIFSAAAVQGDKAQLGYIYVILDSKRSENVMKLLFGSSIGNLAIKTIVIILLLTFLFSFLYLKRVRKNFNKMILVLQRFESGDYAARFNVKSQDEILPVTNAFNKMADLLSLTITKLTRSEKERRTLIASISHDLRTPLSIARGYTETLLLDDVKLMSVERNQFVQLIGNKIQQIENMVQQLFELSKLDAAEFTANKEPFVFSEIVQESVNTQQLIASAKKIELTCSVCQEIKWINADVSMMERAIQNLVDNAIKNTAPFGKVHISLTEENGVIIYTIENEAPPLTQELLQWINRTEWPNDLSINRPAKAGLGLVIVQKILFLHNSRLQAAVNKDRNLFSFRLPAFHPQD